MKTVAENEKIIEELHKRTKAPDLEPLLSVYEALLRLEEAAEVPPLPLEFTLSEARSLLERGIPLLQREGILLQPESMASTWQQVCDLAARHLASRAERLREVCAWPQAQHQVWLATLGQYFRDGEVSTDSQEERDLLTFLLVHTWRTFLRRWAADLAPLVEDEVWQRQRCPVCGGQPDFAYLGAEAGERHLLCARCDTDWRYQRLGCPFCGNQDAATYGYYPGDEGVYRLYACNACRRYLKTLDMREVMGERLLMVERVSTIGMDLSALREGYHGA